MKAIKKSLSIMLVTGLISTLTLALPVKLYADSDRHGHHKSDNHPQVIHRGHRYTIPEKRVRHYRNRRVVRPYGHWYHGYGRYHHDHDAFKWLAFTVITLSVLDNLNESQQRAHEDAQIRATSTPIGERVIWHDNAASGAVTATREGTSTSGRYCREFQQEINIGGRNEQAYGTACRQSDGSWEVISTN